MIPRTENLADDPDWYEDREANYLCYRHRETKLAIGKGVGGWYWRLRLQWAGPFDTAYLAAVDGAMNYDVAE